MQNFGPKMQFFGPKPPFFRVVRTRLNGIISPPYPEATLDNFGFPVGGRLAARRAVFRPPGRNLAISGHSPNTYISTPNFETYLTKLVGTIRVTKKMTNFDYGDGPGRNYGETAVFTFCRKAENGPKIRFFPKKLPKFAKRLIFIGEKGTFSFPQLLPVVARTWLGSKSGCFFLAQKIRISARKSVFSYGTPFFVKGAFVTLGVGSVLAPTYLVYDFSFPSYARFREANPADAPKSLPPPHCGGTVCQ